MKKLIGLTALLAGSAGMFALSAAETHYDRSDATSSYTQAYNGYHNGRYDRHARDRRGWRDREARRYRGWDRDYRR
jgi:hypothetical protein